jgi:hypothetical protein
MPLDSGGVAISIDGLPGAEREHVFAERPLAEDRLESLGQLLVVFPTVIGGAITTKGARETTIVAASR